MQLWSRPLSLIDTGPAAARLWSSLITPHLPVVVAAAVQIFIRGSPAWQRGRAGYHCVTCYQPGAGAGSGGRKAEECEANMQGNHHTFSLLTHSHSHIPFLWPMELQLNWMNGFVFIFILDLDSNILISILLIVCKLQYLQAKWGEVS